MGLKTLCASTSAGLFRIALMPIDACKTILQARLRGRGRLCSAALLLQRKHDGRGARSTIDETRGKFSA